jgi:beta-alanine--pyruvate transaminase
LTRPGASCRGLAAGIDLAPIDGSPGLRGLRALDAAFFEEDLLTRVVGDVRTPPLIASEDDIAENVSKIADILKRLR